MYRRVGSHFHERIDYNGVAFSMELLEWGRTFSDFGEWDSSSYLGLANVPECLYRRWKVKCSLFKTSQPLARTTKYQGSFRLSGAKI